MFASSSIPAAMYTASPRAQLHMMHIQDRLHPSAPHKQRSPQPQPPREQKPQQPTAQDTNVSSLHNTVPHLVMAASDVPPRHMDITCPTEQIDHATNRPSTRHSLQALHQQYGLRSTTPRRSSSGGVSLRRLRHRSSSPQQRRPSHGYDVVTLFGFTHDRAAVREASAVRSSTRLPAAAAAAAVPPHSVQSSDQPPRESTPIDGCERATREVNTQNTATEDLRFSSTSPAQKALPTAVVPEAKTVSTTFIPSIQRSEKSRSGILLVPNASACRLDSSRIVVSEMSIPVENSFHVVLSDPSVSMLISDLDEEEEE